MATGIAAVAAAPAVAGKVEPAAGRLADDAPPVGGLGGGPVRLDIAAAGGELGAGVGDVAAGDGLAVPDDAAVDGVRVGGYGAAADDEPAGEPVFEAGAEGLARCNRAFAAVAAS